MKVLLYKLVLTDKRFTTAASFYWLPACDDRSIAGIQLYNVSFSRLTTQQYSSDTNPL